jgi:hypothetical protein
MPKNPGPVGVQVPPGPSAVGPGGLPDNVAALWAYLSEQQVHSLGHLGSQLDQFAQTVAAALEAQQKTHHHAINLLAHAKPEVFFPSIQAAWLALFGSKATARAQAGVSWRKVVRLVADAVLFMTLYARWLVSAERRARQRQVRQAEALARQWDRALHYLIEAEATAGYRQGGQGQESPVQAVLTYVAGHDPLVRDLISKVATGALDLASVDDPFARLILGHLMTAVIGRLGVDKLAGRFAGDLLAPWLGDPRPRGIKAVTAALTARVGTVEREWAQFYGNGGADVEQAGSQWADLTSPLTDLGLVAFFGAAVADPAGWAAGISGSAGRLAGDTITGAAALIKGA